MNEIKELPISFNFNQDLPLGFVKIKLDALAINPEEYFLAPEAIYDTKTDSFTIVGYGLVHISQLRTEQQYKDKIRSVTG